MKRMKHLTRPLLMGSLLLGLISVLGLSACGQAATDSPAEAVAEVYNAVTLTLAAKPTETFNPTATFTPLATKTLIPTGIISASPTVTLWSYSYSSYSTCTDQSTFVKDVTISDGTELEAGESFTKIWKIKNTGTCTWDSNTTVEFVSGDDLDGESTEIGESVAPGETIEISIDMIAPADPDEYTGYWQLANSSGTLFGSKFYVQIVVSEATSTPTVTQTSSPTATATPGATAVPTSTLVPTNAPSATTAPTMTLTPTETPAATPTTAPSVESSETGNG